MRFNDYSLVEYDFKSEFPIPGREKVIYFERKADIYWEWLPSYPNIPPGYFTPADPTDIEKAAARLREESSVPAALLAIEEQLDLISARAKDIESSVGLIRSKITGIESETGD